MNTKLRNSLNDFALWSGSFIHDLSSTCVSIMRIFILSKLGTAKKSRHYGDLKLNENCTILANGPSLKIAYDRAEVILDNCDVFCVNMMVDWDKFWQIKPRFYFISDGAFFAPRTDRHRMLIQRLSTALHEVDWEMYLCLPTGTANGGLLKEMKDTPIKVIYWNTTTTEGFHSFCNFVFKKRLGMPRCQTVTNVALMASINMKYKNVYLYGADHSWTKDLRVDDDNIVCYGDRHVYATDLRVSKKEGTIARQLRAFANMFDAHWAIREFADSQKVSIWNCTKNSFVDAYIRCYNN